MAGDLFWSDVVFLCHFNGPNGAAVSSGNSPDTSNIHNTLVNASGGVTYDTSTYAFSTASCMYNSGTNALSTGAEVGTEFQFGAGQFTVEGWFYTLTPGAFYSTPTLLSCTNQAPNLGWFLSYYLPVTTTVLFETDVNGADQPLGSTTTSSGELVFTWSDNGTSFTAGLTGNYTFPTRTWVHIAVDRDATNTLRVYANGVVFASATVTDTFFPVVENLGIGMDFSAGTATNTWDGHIDEVRITNGKARYGGAFSPPSAPFPDGPVIANGPMISIIA